MTDQSWASAEPNSAGLREIIRNPAADLPRFRYGLWLMEQDDPVLAARGELILVQCCCLRGKRLDGTPASLADLERWRSIADDHLRMHAATWEASIRVLGCDTVSWLRGFPEQLTFTANQYFTVSAALHANHPVSALGIRGVKSDQVASLGHSLAMGKLSDLNLTGSRIGPEGVSYLTTGDDGFKTLQLTGNAIGDQGVSALLSSSAMYGLRSLDLSYNGIGPEGATLLCDVTRLPLLTEISIHGNGLSEDDSHALDRAMGARRLWQSQHGSIW